MGGHGKVIGKVEGSENLPLKQKAGSGILETETVAARYTTNAGQSLVTATATTITFEDVVEDSHNAYNTATGVYTIPVSGWYAIQGKVAFANLDTVAGEQTIGYIILNGTGIEQVRNVYESTGTKLQSVYNFTQVPLVSGDEIEFQVYQNSGGNESLQTSSAFNVFSIVRQK